MFFTVVYRRTPQTNPEMIRVGAEDMNTALLMAGARIPRLSTAERAVLKFIAIAAESQAPLGDGELRERDFMVLVEDGDGTEVLRAVERGYSPMGVLIQLSEKHTSGVGIFSREVRKVD